MTSGPQSLVAGADQLRLCSRGRRGAAAGAQPPPTAETAGDAASSRLSSAANSYISLGAFETLGASEGRAATGIAYMEEALKLQEAGYAAEQDVRRRGRKALSLSQSLLQIGQQHHQQQDPEEALVHYQRALGLADEFLGVHMPVAPAEAGQPEQADGPQPHSSASKVEGVAKKAIEYGRFVQSEICSSLGVAYNDMGRQDDALAAHQRALALRKETVGKDHPSLAECLNNLGALYFARGALQKAVEHYEQALEKHLAMNQGQQEGPYVAITLYNIGTCRAGLGHSREAGVALRKALTTAEQAFGTDHRQVDLIRETIRMQEQQRPSPGSGLGTGPEKTGPVPGAGGAASGAAAGQP